MLQSMFISQILFNRAKATGGLQVAADGESNSGKRHGTVLLVAVGSFYVLWESRTYKA